MHHGGVGHGYMYAAGIVGWIGAGFLEYNAALNASIYIKSSGSSPNHKRVLAGIYSSGDTPPTIANNFAKESMKLLRSSDYTDIEIFSDTANDTNHHGADGKTADDMTFYNPVIWTYQRSDLLNFVSEWDYKNLASEGHPRLWWE